MVYSIKINLPDDMAPVAVNNNQLSANGGAIMVKYVDDEDKVYDNDEAKPAAAAQVPPPLPPVPLVVAAAMAPRRDHNITGAGREINRMMPTSISMSRSLMRVLYYLIFMWALCTSFDFTSQNQMTLSTALTQR